MPLFLQSFDIILCLNALHHFPDQEDFLEQMFTNCETSVFETNKNQLDTIFAIGAKHGFAVKHSIFTERHDSSSNTTRVLASLSK